MFNFHPHSGLFVQPAPFVHLHVHSCYSLLTSQAKPEALIAQAVKFRMPALALTDQGNLFAAIPFYTGCLKAGIKPILGAQITVVANHRDLSQRPDREIRDQLILLCRNQIGWKNLLILLSVGYLDGFHEKPRVDLGLLRQHNKGLLALSAGLKGGVGRLLAAGKMVEAEQLAKNLVELYQDETFPGFYLELQRMNLPGEETVNQEAIALAHRLGIPLVASTDVHFMTPKDQRAQDALLCVGLTRTLYEENRPRYNEHHAFTPPQEMADLFQDLPEALANTLQIAKRCNLQLELGKTILPDYELPKGENLESWLRREAVHGLEERLNIYVLPRFPESDHTKIQEEYRHRLDYELDVILQMGFPGYFLIVSDFIRWAKKSNIPVGPGRGSGAGSLVAWSLLITDLDPIRYQLLFERFLNPERVSMPDFDVDFCMDQRDKVIQYVRNKYGHDRVAQIITFGGLQARAVLRDVGRVLELPYGRVDRIAKLIPNVLGITLSDAIKQEERLKILMDEEPEIRELIELSLSLEGLPRSAGTHAAGVVMANGPLTDLVPLYRDPRSEMPVTQFNMGDVEKAGLVKFDFLGLKTLTVIAEALKLINSNLALQNQVPIDINQIDLEDKKTFQLLKEGRTRGVFQLESSGMREILKRLAPDTFEEIIALVALYRPGPLGSGMVDDFINRKAGRVAVEYPLPQLEPILNETFGVILYQEQVMKIAQVLAGYSLGGADLLRRAMGKKKPQEMASQREIFLTGSGKNGIDPKKAEYIFDLMEKFAGYGFNKSHSAAYALISYQTAWIKAHFPLAFLAATLTCDMLNTDKVILFIRECREMEITVLPPDINRSEGRFTVEGEAIRYSLAAIKNVGEGAVEAIIAARRQGQPFSGLFDLCRRVGPSHYNRRMMEHIIKAGGFDSLTPNRASLLAALPAAMEQGSKRQEEKSLGILNLFDAIDEPMEGAVSREELPNCPDLNPEEKLTFEKEALGFYITGHPLDRYQEEFTRYGLENMITLKQRFMRKHPPTPSSEGEKKRYGPRRNEHLPVVRVAGLVAASKIHRTKQGEQMAFLTLEDKFGQMEVVIFSDLYKDIRAILEKEAPVIIEGSVESGDEEVKMTAIKVMDVDILRALFCRSLRIRVSIHLLSKEILQRLETIFSRHSGGNCQAYMEILFPKARCEFLLGDAFRLHPNERLLKEIQQLFGPDSIIFESD
ncbi:MAG: DNA polymerase III subunit alpha [Magnetococcus sp. DMHC-6]